MWCEDGLDICGEEEGSGGEWVSRYAEDWNEVHVERVFLGLGGMYVKRCDMV